MHRTPLEGQNFGNKETMKININTSSALHDSPKNHSPSARGRPRGFNIDNALDEAMKLFWERGYSQTTIVDICNAIGIKPPSFYHAFGSKEELFLKTLEHYNKTYWDGVTDKFFAETDIYEAVKNLFEASTGIYMRPNLPKGCFIDISTVGLSSDEQRIHEAISKIQENAKNNIRKRLLRAIESGQLPSDCNVHVITGALYTFLKGISTVARDHICLAEMNEFCKLGISLLPPKK